RAVGWAPNSMLARVQRFGAARGGERRSALATATSYLARLADAGSADDLDQYLALVGSSTSARGLSAVRFATDARLARRAVASRCGLDVPEGSSTLRRLQDFELRTYLPCDLLTKEDRATMAVGLEGRVPLLDSEVVDLAARTPDDQKISLFQGKRVVRRVAGGQLGRAA